MKNIQFGSKDPLTYERIETYVIKHRRNSNKKYIDGKLNPYFQCTKMNDFKLFYQQGCFNTEVHYNIAMNKCHEYEAAAKTKTRKKSTSKLNDACWNKMYKQLIVYKKKHKGSTNPSVKNSKQKGEQQLGEWVNRQRQCYTNHKLSVERIDSLEAIGFAWDPFDTKWNKMYKRAIVYQKEHNGSTHVPKRTAADKELARWVANQRTMYEKKGNTKHRNLDKRQKILELK